MNARRLLSVFVLVVIALGIVAACVPQAPTVIDSQAVGAQEEFKTILVKGKSDLRGPVTMGGAAALNGGAAIVGSLTISGYQQYPVSYWDMDGVNGAMAAHGLPGAPTYPHCMLYTPVWTTATVYISSANATSVTLAMPYPNGTPYTGDPLAVRCSAVYVP